MRHFRTFRDISVNELKQLIDLTLQLKKRHGQEPPSERMPLAGKVLGLLFEKPSMRTRVSFESAIYHLGGASIFLSDKEVGLGKRETVADFARVISTYVDLLAVRTFSQDVIDELALYSSVPVINALSDAHHPCQALADLVTIREEFGKLEGLKVAFVGDGNNVARSMAVACAYAGMEFVMVAPPGYQLTDGFLASCAMPETTGRVSQCSDPVLGVSGADVVYTDVWASMGQETEQAERRRAFIDYQVNESLMAQAKPEARFLHCLPAHRGEEVTAGVIDGPASRVIPQAANRLHAQKALMYWLMLPEQRTAS